ncbi:MULTISPECIES: hypothetical protein [Bacillus cereus group]|uniref:hypothetical protein n=1 Tax=Bacillus TaxID=1386 RepID=UPI0001A02F77|nr:MULTISPECIES: hypothetical protein [Bacillus cereus group]EEK64323.1 hypothetical protein bcere0006_55840 [Bacillus wiedmannii]KXI53817.1 hypothetical protein ACS95_06825 [Bacillus cereus]MCU5247360.1 hypothetical protein [Bacillus pacificus]MDA2667216.1 hypothetical protein [Bacillus cereus group sp. Bc032]MDA2677921.1 hypothetical protein [Bacillus cereus group sp. Bc031]
MTYGTGDIIRFKDEKIYGLFEITGVIEEDTYQYTVTSDECDTEYYAKHKDLIFVCHRSDRKDL